jgi:hypothetical protein
VTKGEKERASEELHFLKQPNNHVGEIAAAPNININRFAEQEQNLMLNSSLQVI